MGEYAFEPLFNIVHQLPLASGYTVTDSLSRAGRWWRTVSADVSTGVCCLVGIGGSGKTAAADELLRRLAVLAQRPGAGHAPFLPAPGAAFVFTLAQDSVESLIQELRLWVPSFSAARDNDGYEGLVRDLGRAGRSGTADGPILLVIDGLEVVQSTGGPDGVGRIIDQRLRDLLTRAAYGALPGIALLVTTRLAPADIEIQRLPFYTRVDMDAMDPAAAVELLRSRGLRGSDRELRRIGASYGYHALTLDLAARLGPLPDLASNEVGTTGVLTAYVTMARSGAGPPESGDLIELLSFFKRGATPTLLAAVVDRLGLTAPDQMESALQWLTDVRLVTRSDRRDKEDLFVMHEVVRVFVHNSVAAERRRAWHSEIARVWDDDIGNRWASLDTTSRWDVLEAWLSHLALGEDPMLAFLAYREQVGHFVAIGHQASKFAWGESICRILNQDLPPEQLAPYLQEDPRGAGPALLADWALYLTFLGETATALRAHQAAYRIALASDVTVQLPVAARNVSDVYAQSGELVPAERWANEAFRHANEVALQFEGMPTEEVMRGFDESFHLLTLVQLYTSGVDAAGAMLNALANIHAKAKSAIDSYNTYALVPLGDAPTFDPERFLWGTLLAQILLMRGDDADAVRVAEHNLDRWFANGHSEELTSASLRALLVRALLNQGTVSTALPHLQALEGWARANEVTTVMCEAYLLGAKVAAVQHDFAALTENAESGLRLAREAGLGLLHIELLIESAWAFLKLGEPDDAAYAAATALFGQEPATQGVALYKAPARDERLAVDAARSSDWYNSSGIFPPADSGRPNLLAATHPSCAYRLGEAHARAALAEALLARLARYSGRVSWRIGKVTADAEAMISYATDQLKRAAELLDEVSGPSKSGDKLRERIAELGAGLLTHYPIQINSSVDIGETSRPTPRRVLISYSRSDEEFVDRLADELRPAVEDVWVDRRKISIGESFVAAINRALVDVTDFIVVLTATSVRSLWVRNELDAAIALRNAGSSITIYPVLLDGVSVPPLISDLNAFRSEERDAITVAARITTALQRHQ
jgi:hypothetical protein